MAAYANLHIAFEQMRIRALDQMKGTGGFTPPQHGESTEPPRVLILGPENSGKTSISKIFCRLGSRSVRRTGRGKTVVAMSVTMLSIVFENLLRGQRSQPICVEWICAYQTAVSFRHVPSTDGFQNRLIGVQMNMAENIVPREYMTMMAINHNALNAA